MSKENVVEIVFDEKSPNWSRNMDYNLYFLRTVQNHLNHQLEAQGHIFMNEVLDALGLRRTPRGALTGWLLSEGNHIDLGITEFVNQANSHGDFKNRTNEPAELRLKAITHGIIYTQI